MIILILTLYLIIFFNFHLFIFHFIIFFLNFDIFFYIHLFYHALNIFTTLILLSPFYSLNLVMGILPKKYCVMNFVILLCFLFLALNYNEQIYLRIFFFAIFLRILIFEFMLFWMSL